MVSLFKGSNVANNLDFFLHKWLFLFHFCPFFPEEKNLICDVFFDILIEIVWIAGGPDELQVPFSTNTVFKNV